MTILYTISGCIRCELAKNILTSHGVFFEEVNIIEHPSRQKEIKMIHHVVVTPLFVSKNHKWLLEDLLLLEKEMVIR